MESRNNKKRCMGRVTKNLADLTLQSGLVADSLSLYHNSAEILKSVNDWLWLAAAKEGIYFFIVESMMSSSYVIYIWLYFQDSVLHLQYFSIQICEIQRPYNEMLVYKRVHQTKLSHSPYSNQTLILFENTKPRHRLSDPRKILVL